MTKTIKKVIAGVSAIAIIAGAAVGGWAINEYVIKDNQFAIIDQADGGDGGMIVGESEDNGVSLMSTKIAPADYEEYGISPMAESAQQLTATITPADATNKEVDWSVAWVNASSAWANGKTVTDYVTVTPTSDGALTANVECKQAFGEQVKVTVTSRQNKNASASATVDYAKRVTAGTLALAGTQVGGAPSSITASTAGSEYTYNIRNGYDAVDMSIQNRFTPTQFSVGTVNDSFTYSYRYSFSSEWLDALSNNYFTPEVNADEFYTMNSLFFGTFIGYEAIPDMQSVLMEDFAMGGSAGYYINYVHAILELAGEPMMTIQVTGTGKYSTFTASVDISVDPSAFDIFVSNISLDIPNLVF